MCWHWRSSLWEASMSGLSWHNATAVHSTAPSFPANEIYMRLFLHSASNPGNQWLKYKWAKEHKLFSALCRSSLNKHKQSCTCAFLTFPDSHSRDHFCSVRSRHRLLWRMIQQETTSLQIGASPSWANCTFPWRWFGNTGFYQGVPPSGLPRASSIYIFIVQRTAMKPLGRSGLDKRIAFWCGFGQLLTWVIPSPRVICVELHASAYV